MEASIHRLFGPLRQPAMFMAWLGALAGCATPADHPEVQILRTAPDRPQIAPGTVQDKGIGFEKSAVPTPAETEHPSSAPTVFAPNPRDNQTTVLAPYLVKDDPVGCFGMSLRIRKDVLSQNVAEITVFRVLPDSPAAKAGLEALTTIQKIDGRPVRDFLASFRKGSDLNRKLMRRKLGDQITLEVLTPGSPVPKVVTLTEGAAKSKFGSDAMGPGAGWPSIGR